MNRVPICSKYCDDWFEACKDDMTCAQDWLNGFNFTSNVYSCPTSSTCRPFSEVTLVKLFCARALFIHLIDVCI